MAKEIVLDKAKTIIPEYKKDFNAFWNTTIKDQSDEDLRNLYLSTILFKNWIICLENNHKSVIPILNEIFQDINSSLFLGYFGFYRSSYLHLRSSIELSLQTLYFVDHNIELLLWNKGEFVMKHDKLTEYLKNNPKLDLSITNNILDTISQSWKKFSKHIHGETPEYFQTERDIVKLKKFTVKDFNTWKSHHLKIVKYLNFLFIHFFRKTFNSFPSLNRKVITDSIKKNSLSDLLK